MERLVKHGRPLTRRDLVRSYNHGDYAVIDGLVVAAMLQKRIVQIGKGCFAAAVTVDASMDSNVSHFARGEDMAA